MPEYVLSYASGTIAASLRKTKKTLVEGVTFSIRHGESLALIGETGSGKTMIARSILGLLPRNVRRFGGDIRLDGAAQPPERALRRLRGNRIVYIPQSGQESLNPARTVRKHFRDQLRKLGVPRSEWEAVALDRLRLAGLAEAGDVLGKYPFQLSGGMAQRVTIALAACADPALVIADEPTNGLDEAAQQAFLRLLEAVFPTAGRLIITHDIRVAALCDRILVLCAGKPMELGGASAVLNAPKHPYTRSLLAALVENGMAESPVLRTGDAPCPFYPRCAEADGRCLSDIPLRSTGGREWRCSR